MHHGFIASATHLLGRLAAAGPLGVGAQPAPPTDGALLAAHHTVAILPFGATVQVMGMHDLTHVTSTTKTILNQRSGKDGPPPDAAQQQRQMEVAYQMQGLTMQQLQDHQPKHGYRVQWQPVAETNRRLLAAGIAYAELAGQPLARLQQVLGVDALLTGQVLLYQPIPKTWAWPCGRSITRACFTAPLRCRPARRKPAWRSTIAPAAAWCGRSTSAGRGPMPCRQRAWPRAW